MDLESLVCFGLFDFAALFGLNSARRNSMSWQWRRLDTTSAKQTARKTIFIVFSVCSRWRSVVALFAFGSLDATCKQANERVDGGVSLNYCRQPGRALACPTTTAKTRTTSASSLNSRLNRAASLSFDASSLLACRRLSLVSWRLFEALMSS